MNTKKVATEYRIHQWAQLLRERIENGETIKEFCENRGCSKNTYFYWQRKLRETAAKKLISETTKMSSNAIVPSGWIHLAENEPKNIENRSLIIEIGDYRIIVDNNTDPELLAKVCGVFKSIC